MRFLLFDYIAACSAVLALVVVFMYASDSSGNISNVVIQAEGVQWVYPLETDGTLNVPGPLGTTVVVIEDGHVGVTDSPCREKTCIAASPVERPGTWVACLPNRVFIRIEGVDAEDIDAGTY